MNEVCQNSPGLDLAPHGKEVFEAGKLLPPGQGSSAFSSVDGEAGVEGCVLAEVLECAAHRGQTDGSGHLLLLKVYLHLLRSTLLSCFPLCQLVRYNHP